MPQVCWIFEFPTVSGGENSLLACEQAIRAAGVEPIALAPSAGPLAETLRQRKIEVVDFQVRSNKTGVKRPQPELRDRLSELIAELKPDLVHANSLSMGRLVGPVTAELGLPGIGHLRDIVKLSAAAMADVNRLHRILAVSAATRDCHIAQGLSADKSFVLHNGVNLESFRPRPATGWLHQELQLPTETKLVASIGQLVIRKGHDVFLQAAENVVSQFADVHFLLIGERYSGKDEALRYLEALENAANSPPLAGRVTFLGYREDVRSLLSELSLLVHTARQEPLGRVLLEAAACGVPVIATDVGGTLEIFPPEADAAVVVPVDDAQAFAQAMSTLLNDSARCQRLSANARARVQAAFDVHHAAAGLIEHYQSVLRDVVRL